MKKLLNNPWISGSLALLALILVGNSLLGPSAPSYTPPAHAANDDYAAADEAPPRDDATYAPSSFDRRAIQALAAQSPQRNIFAREQSKAPATQPPPEKAMSEATITLRGIWIQDRQRYALVDDQTLQTGQTHGLARLQGIEEHGIWLSYDGEEHFLALGHSWTYRYPSPQGQTAN